jgi:excisionase family DNA binding protein
MHIENDSLYRPNNSCLEPTRPATEPASLPLVTLPATTRPLDLFQAARFLKVHPKTLQRLAKAGRLPACKVGRSWIFVEHLLVQHLVSKSLSRVSVVDLQEKSECRSTDARTHRFGGSSCRQSKASRSLYSKALGLPTND